MPETIASSASCAKSGFVNGYNRPVRRGITLSSGFSNSDDTAEGGNFADNITKNRDLIAKLDKPAWRNVGAICYNC
jgi:hypothetical protein